MPALGNPIVLDGSYGEGSGALVRTALAMSALTQQPVRLHNVRGANQRSGLTSEDLAIIRALAVCCSAEVAGAEIGESSFAFMPTSRVKGLNEKLDVPDSDIGPGHANALVVLNSLLPVLSRSGVFSAVMARGETYGHNVLSYDYFANVTLPILRRFGLYAYADQTSAGFGRGSRGEIGLEIEPSALTGVSMEDRGKLLAVRAVVATGDLPEPVGQRGVAHLARLGFYGNVKIEADAVTVRSKTPGSFATVWGEFENAIGGATAMGARGMRIEAVVQNAFESFSDWVKTDCTVDPYLADQLILPASLADGETILKVSQLTQRFLTMVWVIKQFLPIHITIRGQEGQPGVVTVKR